MRPKTIIILIIVILLALTLLALTRTTGTTIIGISKTSLTITDVILAFILGYMIGRPGRRSKLRYIPDDTDHTNTDTLSEEDRRYIE